jgi:hypothetical protein
MANDPFASAPAAPSVKFPTMKQLGTGAKKHAATYAPGTVDEVVKKDNVGRALLLKPVKFEKDAPSSKAPSGKADRWKVDVVALDGEKITDVYDKDGESTYTFPDPLVAPFLLPQMFVSQTMLVGQLNEFMGQPDHSPYMLVRLMLLPPKSAGGNKAWAFGAPITGDAELAHKWLDSHPEPDLFA